MRASEIILEAGVDISDIHHTAIKELTAGLDQYVKVKWETFFQQYKKEHPQSQEVENYELYHDAYDKFCNDHYVEDFVKEIATASSVILTTVVKEALRARHGDTIILSSGMKPTNDITVDLTVKEYSSDSYKDTAGGYFSSVGKIVVFIGEYELKAAGLSAIQELIFGESEERHLLARTIIPTFTHEYAHFEQSVRGGWKARGDQGYTRVGKGQRWRRDHTGGKEGWVRYIGAQNEIDSFAASTASSIVSKLEHDYNFREDILSELQGIALGYSDDRHLKMIEDTKRAAFEGFYDDIGLDPKDMEVVWKRYLKILYSKLIEFLPKKEKRGNYPEQWYEWAELGVKTCASKLALMACEKIRKEDRWSSPDDIIDRYAPEIVSQATFFLQDQLFEDPWVFERNAKVSAAFKSLVKKTMIAYDEAHDYARAA